MDEAQDVFGDFVRRREYTERLSSALVRWEQFCNSIPPEWLYLDAEMIGPINLDLGAVHTLLRHFENDAFWKWQ